MNAIRNAVTGAFIGITALVPAAAHPRTQAPDVVIGDVCYAAHGPGCRPGDRWWLIVRDHRGAERRVEVPSRAVYDACGPRGIAPTYYPACAMPGRQS